LLLFGRFDEEIGEGFNGKTKKGEKRIKKGLGFLNHRKSSPFNFYSHFNFHSLTT